MKSGIAGCFFPLRSLLIIAEVWNVFSKSSIILPKIQLFFQKILEEKEKRVTKRRK